MTDASGAAPQNRSVSNSEGIKVARHWQTWHVVLLVAVFFLLGLSIGFFAGSHREQVSDGKRTQGNKLVTKEAYEKIKLGMTWVEVQELLGDEGVGIGGGTIGSVRKWENGDASITVTFDTGPTGSNSARWKVIDKRAKNLR